MTNTFPQLPAPRTAKIPFVEERHGIRREDDYGWLRAENWQDVFKDPALLDPMIGKHLEEENAYQTAMMEDTAGLRKTLFAEMRGRIKEDDSSVPMKDGPFAYGTSYRKGGEQPRFFRTPRDGGAEEMLLDGDQEADGKAYFHLGGIDHSGDHTKLVWGYDDKGSEFYTLKIRDLASGKDSADLIRDTGGSGVWDATGTGFFYTWLDPNHRPSKIFRHAAGTDQAKDRVIFEEQDPGFFLDAHRGLKGDWIFISSHDHETSEYHILPAADPGAAPRLVMAREPGVQYDLDEGGEEFFILTNADGARDFKIVTAPAADPGKAHWKELVPHEPGRLILSIMAFERFLLRLERKDGLPRIVVRERSSGEEHMISFAEEAYSLGLSGAYEYDTDVIRFSYSSMTTPAQVFDYNMRSRERTLLKTQEVPSGHDPEDYVTRRLMAPSHDGEMVPISILYHKHALLDGSAPCLLYGYGAYGITIPASFNTNCLSLVDRGFVYAIAHIRGGKDKGFGWYEDGKRDRKMNTFEDFIFAARYLVEKGYTSHDHIVAQGGSAGGMLIGAVANMAPETFGGLIAEVPFVDVLATMLDDTLPLTPPEWPEWGNPIASAEDYRMIASYSPCDNVAEKAYPPILAVAGLTDPRVTYW
ncbi:MAG: S9 family peptidase, partial [Rhizobiaceae bacterium]